jgi:succinyl-CoA synthetase alpha subunit
MSIYVNKNTRILVHGITNDTGTKVTKKMLDFGTNVVAGVSPGNGGEWVLQGKVPVFDSARTAVEVTGANTALITVPARFAKDALLECASAGISLVICATENIPLKDIIIVKQFCQRHNVKLLGPSSPGIFSPETAMIGSFPFQNLKSGNVGVVSRSGSLTYEVMNVLAEANIGISTCVGIGAAPIHGMGFIEILNAMQMDPQTEKIILIGRVDHPEEEEALQYAVSSVLKPIVVFFYGYCRADYVDIENVEATFPLARTLNEIPSILQAIK